LKTFAELDLIAPVQRALVDEGYETPTAIQSQTVPAALLGRDVLGCAQTGTGKTAAFALPILNRLGQQNRKAIPHRPLVLVLAPTRELAIQIGDSFKTYGRHLRLRQVVVYGGVGQASQVRALSRGAHIMVATPGRLLDLMNQGHIQVDQLEVFVLDEVDRMLDMGFLPDLKRIISKLPKQRHSLFFSATLPPNITELSNQLLTNPIRVNVTPKSTSVEKIDQQVIFVERSAKQALLRQILTGKSVGRALVFTKTKRGANQVAEKLERSGVKATAIHGNKSQNARQKALDAFRRRHVQVLVATDVASRGIDVDGITHVVNFDLPIEPDSYVHRIGRTGRAGAEGIAVSFCAAMERPQLRAIEKLIGKKVPLAPDQPVPTERDPQSEPVKKSPGRRYGASKGPASKGPASKGLRTEGSASRFSAEGSGDHEQKQPKERRRRRRKISPSNK